MSLLHGWLRRSVCTLTLLFAGTSPILAQSVVPQRGEGPVALSRLSADWQLYRDPRLVPQLPSLAPPAWNASASRWPDDPAAGGLLGGAIGCAAGWLLFVVWDTKRTSGNDPAWGCLIVGAIGMALGGQRDEPGRRFLRPTRVAGDAWQSIGTLMSELGAPAHPRARDPSGRYTPDRVPKAP